MHSSFQVNCGGGEDGKAMLGSQFFLTLGEDIEYLDAEHCVFGEVRDRHPRSFTRTPVLLSSITLLFFRLLTARKFYPNSTRS